MTDAGLRRLVRRFQAGDERAWDSLDGACQRLIEGAAWYVRRRAVFSDEPVEHLIAEARIGLLRAAREYDHRPGVLFTTFAIFHARNAVRKYLRHHGRTIAIPAWRIEPRAGRDEELARLKPFSLTGWPDTPKMDRDLAQTEARIAAEQLLALLPERDAEIVRLRMLEDVSAARIGEWFGLNHIYVMKVVRTACARMRAKNEAAEFTHRFTAAGAAARTG
ncbi:MAG: sigma-70 family RNA polymerase sigma factor [Verrucomicrobia subdivision 3 bacterium]|nr:sigma-70 family RNA polymerase sigma factor [Limisphaerales bacterium]